MMGGGHESQKDHKVDVPAMETALMTISFLTLAVFLIKLVLVGVNRTMSIKKNFYSNLISVVCSPSE